jgi:hypothetical protein
LLGKDSGISPWLFITAALLGLLLDEQLRCGKEMNSPSGG